MFYFYFKTNYKVIIIKTGWYWQKISGNTETGQWKRIDRPETDQENQNQLTDPL